MLVGCTSLLNQLPAEVSDLSTLKSTDRLYILTVFVDEDVEDLINDLASVETGTGTETLYNIYAVYEDHPTSTKA